MTFNLFQNFVYFFFREAAVEYINCGKAVFSRVARVCKNDQGGPHKAKYSWTSFLKARLNCSVPGDYPFYFDEIQGVSTLVRGRYGDQRSRDSREEILYATFSTPENSIGGSAVCAFRLRDVADAFAGRFKEQRSMGSNWLAVEPHKVPRPRPGTCINDTKSLPDLNLNFIKTHSLMDDTVAPFFGAPLVVRTGLVSRFTVLAVDPQVKTTSGDAYDVVFIGEDLLKTFENGASHLNPINYSPRHNQREGHQSTQLQGRPESEGGGDSHSGRAAGARTLIDEKGVDKFTLPSSIRV